VGLTGISHVGLTVTDLDRSAAWYTAVLGWKELMRDRGETSAFAYGMLPGGITLVLRQHDAGESDPFSECRAGLDHLSFSIESMDDLNGLEARLQGAGTAASPVSDMPHAWMLTFRDPDNIALEVTLGK
jgi:glyoxylase I family protein